MFYYFLVYFYINMIQDCPFESNAINEFGQELYVYISCIILGTIIFAV